MRILVKKDNVLHTLGEGRIFSKKQLSIREGLDASLGTANGLQQAQLKARKTINQNSNVDSVSGDLGHLDGQNDTSSGEGTKIQIPVNAPASQLNTVSQMAKSQANDDVEVEFTKNNDANSQTSTNESKKRKNVMEMRYNSVPFTKEELSKFLKSL